MREKKNFFFPPPAKTPLGRRFRKEARANTDSKPKDPLTGQFGTMKKGSLGYKEMGERPR